ncbi:MAG: family N-acetyltransferase [Frankiales bacterium]|nr:family N-acetyltransferase [Frankiales bacterium]
MARHELTVRAATAADLPALLELGDELRDQLLPSATLRRATGAAARQQLSTRYEEALADPQRHVVLAVCSGPAGEEVLGMGLMTLATANALIDVPAVHLSHAVVAGRHRRRGAGRALVAAAATWAEELGVEQLVVAVHPGARDANRFLARLGFAPVDLHRSAPVSAVRRRLLAADVRPLDHVIRRRRAPVRRPRGNVLPLGPANTEEV